MGAVIKAVMTLKVLKAVKVAHHIPYTSLLQFEPFAQCLEL
jgi:hypothetical protein